MATSLSRRQFLKLTTGALTGAAAVQMAGCGLVGSSSDRAPKGARVQAGREVASVCPYCAVGCGQIVTVADGQILDIQGNPDSPINVGTLCPKGAATYQLAVNPNRWTTVKYRAPSRPTGWRCRSTGPWTWSPTASRKRATRTLSRP
jgi:formate dehydrogenase major subunit